MEDQTVIHVRQFKGDDTVREDHQAVSPTVYDDGTIEVKADLAGKDCAVYVRLNVAELVRIATTYERDEAPE